MFERFIKTWIALVITTFCSAESRVFTEPLELKEHARAVKNGLQLSVHAMHNASLGNIVVKCELRNVGNQGVAYDDLGGSLLFSFKVTDLAGNLVPLRSPWKPLDSFSDPSRHWFRELPPGGAIQYEFDLKEAAENQLPMDVLVNVGWAAGKGNSDKISQLSSGPNVTVAVLRLYSNDTEPVTPSKSGRAYIPSSDMNSSAVSNGSKVNAGANPETVRTDTGTSYSQSKRVSSLVLWSVGWAVLLLPLFILLWIRRKRRRGKT